MDPDVGAMRREYEAGGLAESEAPADPFALFTTWFAAAVEASAAGASGEANAMVVSTIGRDGQPSSRTVLLKGFDAEGFVFFTNYGSRKGTELAASARCSLLFPWYALQRQVRVEGIAEQVPRSESEAYFATRPRESQVGAWASRQSHRVADRAELEAAYASVTDRFEGGEVPCPPFWGGYLVRPSAFEFWQGRRGRMHDRLSYERTDPARSSWTRSRLAP
ncbi:MAG TPA: pyridoxamine 5'-phosphate oxidase [Marmoricola sp.]